MKSKLFSGVKQFWQLNIYKRHFLSQEETEAVTDFRFSMVLYDIKVCYVYLCAS